MEIIVQKFGGTSVSTEVRRNQLAAKVKTAIDEGMKPVVVVSAMGRKGDPYATDTLLSIVGDKFLSDNKNAQDLLMCCGEIISSVVVCNTLYNYGIKAVPLTGGQAGILTDDNFTNANFINTDPGKILEVLNEGKVPVVTGFQGITKDGLFTTLGRGGSDTSACILGVALKAKEIEIYTDVDGIMTADPRLVDDVSLIDEVSYNEVYQLADQGAKVIHPKAVDLAKKANIPIVIRNTMSDSKGTLIIKEVSDENRRFITGITHLDNRIQVRVRLSENPNHVAYRSLLDNIAKNNISLDLINIFPAHQIFTINADEKEKLNQVLTKANINFTTVEECSTIAIVGSGMTGVPGIMAKIINTLTENNIEVLQTTDSNITIWCLIHTSKLSQAMKLLHERFGL
ncbi:aspartate kinase [Clostridium sp. NSJ-6]|uniref:Aspartokinase n=1 Tax=Clostridium hominis TaxID=2763036 RepID=A0ABR7DD11_9CLOT|nr:aspartate kinase [Clostridium hominis]MBC5629280.1 aspartate kinase [Clostridium hominis]